MTSQSNPSKNPFMENPMDSFVASLNYYIEYLEALKAKQENQFMTDLRTKCNEDQSLFLIVYGLLATQLHKDMWETNHIADSFPHPEVVQDILDHFKYYDLLATLHSKRIEMTFPQDSV